MKLLFILCDMILLAIPLVALVWLGLEWAHSIWETKAELRAHVDAGAPDHPLHLMHCSNLRRDGNYELEYDNQYRFYGYSTGGKLVEVFYTHTCHIESMTLWVDRKLEMALDANVGAYDKTVIHIFHVELEFIDPTW